MANGRNYETLKWEIKIGKIDLCHGENMRNAEIASSAEYRMDGQFQNCEIF